MNKIYIEEQPSPEQLQAMQHANHILGSVGLELIGTRPKDR